MKKLIVLFCVFMSGVIVAAEQNSAREYVLKPINELTKSAALDELICIENLLTLNNNLKKIQDDENKAVARAKGVSSQIESIQNASKNSKAIEFEDCCKVLSKYPNASSSYEGYARVIMESWATEEEKVLTAKKSIEEGLKSRKELLEARF